MNKWHLIIDIAKCHDCNNCFLACKDEFVENDFPPYSLAQPKHGHRWMNIMRKERGQYPKVEVAYLPIPCMHCDEAPCMQKSKNGAVYKREDGIVLIDPEKAKGKKYLLDACPYGAIWWNEEKNLPQKCTFCAHLLDGGWKEPRCVQACPTGAMKVIHTDNSEIEKIIESEKLEVYKPEFNTSPCVFYKNSYLFTTCFIAGNVAFKDTDECAEGATIILSDVSKKISEKAVTNNYGDFKIDGLKDMNGIYNLSIEYSGYQKQVMEIGLETSINLGTIFLSKKG